MLLDSGNFSDAPSPAGGAKTEALIEGMGRLGYGAAGIGERDLAAGYAEFVRRTSSAPFPLVSTNVVRKDTGEAAFRPWAVVEAPRGGGKPALRVGVLSVVRFNPLFLKAGPEGTNLVVAPPVESVRRHIEEVRQRSDIVVLLAAMDRDEARRIAREVGGIDLIAGAYGGLYSSTEEAEGSTRIVYTQNQGRRVSETRFFLDENGGILSAESWMYFLGGRYPDDPDLRRFVGDSIARLSGRAPGKEGAIPAVDTGAKVGSGSSP